MKTPFLPILLLPLLACHAGDWPQWRGPARDSHVPKGDAVPAKLPDDPKVIWKMNIGEGFASPVVARGKVFYLDNQAEQEIVHAIDAATGKEIWKATLFSSHKDGFGIGPRCTPLVDGDVLYVQSCKGEFQ